MTEMGEYVVGAYLSLIEKCDAVVYNVRHLGGGRKGQEELDVIGYRFEDNSVFICEEASHLGGFNNGMGPAASLKLIEDKHERQKQYAEEHLQKFEKIHFMFWSPKVPEGIITKGLNEMHEKSGLELIINNEYAKKVDILKEEAKKTNQNTGNPFFRILQLLESLHLKK